MSARKGGRYVKNKSGGVKRVEWTRPAELAAASPQPTRYVTASPPFDMGTPEVTGREETQVARAGPPTARRQGKKE